MSGWPLDAVVVDLSQLRDTVEQRDVVLVDARDDEAARPGALAEFRAVTPLDVDIVVVAEHDRFLPGRQPVSDGQGSILGVVSDKTISWQVLVHEILRRTERDVVLVTANVAVGKGWFEGLREAAHHGQTIMTASAVDVGASIVATQPAPGVHGLATYREIPAASARCAYFRRPGINILLNDLSASGEDVETDIVLALSRAVSRRGLHHVLASTVVVGVPPGQPVGGHEPQTEPFGQRTPLSEAVDWDRAAADAYAEVRARGLRVGIDATGLAPHWTGTHVNVANTTAALARAVRGSGSTIGIITDRTTPPEMMRRLESVERLAIHQAADLEPTQQFDVLYRPFQTVTVDTMRWMRRYGRRVIVEQLDFIAYDNAEYVEGSDAWRDVRVAQRAALLVSDGIAWLTEFVRSEALRRGLMTPWTSDAVVGSGVVDETATPEELIEVQPQALDSLHQPFLLFIGRDYLHKSRDFVLMVFQALRRRGWDGMLVLAGADAPAGSTAANESAILRQEPELERHIRRLGHVSEGERRWLLRNAAAGIYPSTTEGFGLVPFEFAACGTPVVSSRLASLSEVLPQGIVDVRDFDVERCATALLEILTDSAAALRQVQAIQAAGADHTWDRVAARLLELFHHVVSRPVNPLMSLLGAMEQQLNGHEAAATQASTVQSGSPSPLPATPGGLARRWRDRLLPASSRRGRALRSLRRRMRRR